MRFIAVNDLNLALNHGRDRNGFFVILTGYLDESGTHAGSVVTVMGGSMANVRQWSRFEEQFNKLRKRYGFTVFHTKKFKKKGADFKGWSDDKCLSLVHDLAALTEESFMESVCMSIDNADYKSVFTRELIPKKVPVPTVYGLCFSECLYQFMVEAARRRLRNKLPVLHVICESGHKNAGDAERLFHQIKGDVRHGDADVLGTITFAEKAESPGLMMADFIAHTRYTRDVKYQTTATNYAPGLVNKKHKGIVYLTFKSGGLVARRDEMIRVAALRKASSRNEPKSS